MESTVGALTLEMDSRLVWGRQRPGNVILGGIRYQPPMKRSHQNLLNLVCVCVCVRARMRVHCRGTSTG
jgi:hypothetical protein